MKRGVLALTGLALLALMLLPGCAGPRTPEPARKVVAPADTERIEVRAALLAFDVAARAVGVPGILARLAGSPLRGVANTLLPPRELDVSGVWTGQYLCPQGTTGLTLSIAQRGRQLDARFDFYALPVNPRLDSGSYAMTGTIEDRIVILEPDRWLVHPPGWFMVGLAATVPEDSPDRMLGAILDERCEGLALERE